MRGKVKIALIIASCILLSIAMTTMGFSYAVWTSPDGEGTGGDQSTATPSVTPDYNYVWAKYFGYRVLTDENGNLTNQVEVDEFYSDQFGESAGINLQDVYIPSEFWVKSNGERIYTQEEKSRLDKETPGAYTTYQVTTISNTLFKDATLQELPVSVHIPESVTKIKASTFVNLKNLERVVFKNANPCEIEPYAFVNCPMLSVIEKGGQGDIIVGKTSILGCATSTITTV